MDMTARGAWARGLSTVAAAWLISLGVDVLLHGGLLASHYTAPTPFLLDPHESFRRIPFGYLTFLLLTISLYWLLRRLGIRGGRPGFKYGGAAGCVVWGALVLGLYSITTAPAGLLTAWWIGQSLELGLAGAVIGSSNAGARPGRIWAVVLVAVLACFAATVILQSVGWAPVTRIG
jgi:hypothetical protein